VCLLAIEMLLRIATRLSLTCTELKCLTYVAVFRAPKQWKI
jgi:hypothetical protein